MNHTRHRKYLLAGVFLLSLALLTGCTTAAVTTTASPSAAPVESATAVITETAAVTESAAATETASVAADVTVSAGAAPTATPQAVTLPVFNADELAKYDGQNGNPAYIAVNGKVYDVSDVPQWSGGSHFGRFKAGVDLSEGIKQSPHGTAKLDSVPIVGLYQP